MSHDLFDHPATLHDVPYSRRAGRVLGAPVAPADVPHACADAEADLEADDSPKWDQPTTFIDRLLTAMALGGCMALVLWSVETLVR